MKRLYLGDVCVNRFCAGNRLYSLFIYKVSDKKVTSEHLQGHARQSDSEILQCCMKTAAQQPFSQRASYLIECYYQQQKKHGNLIAAECNVTGSGGKEYRFHQDGREHGGSGHSEQPGVDQRRGYGCQQSGFPSIFVGTDEREELYGQPRGSSCGEEVEQLRQYDIPGYEHQRSQVSLYLIVIQ